MKRAQRPIILTLFVVLLLATPVVAQDIRTSGDVYVDGESLYLGDGLLQWENGGLLGTRFRLSDLQVTGEVLLSKTLYIEGTKSVESDGDQWIYFYDGGLRDREYLAWDDDRPSFILSSNLRLTSGALYLRHEDEDFNFSLSTYSDAMRFIVDKNDNTSPISANYYTWFEDSVGLADRLMQLDNSGNLAIGGALTQNGFDLAEAFLPQEPVSPGDLVRTDPRRPDAVVRTSAAYDQATIGVISTEPGVVLGGGSFGVDDLRDAWGNEVAARYESQKSALMDRVERTTLKADARRLRSFETFVASREKDAGRIQADLRLSDEDLRRRYEQQRKTFELEVESFALREFVEQTFAPVALAGRVEVRADASFGAIEIGDPLTSSPLPGTAMKATRPGLVVGTALEALGEGTGKILVLVDRGWWGGGTERRTHGTPATGTHDPEIASSPQTPLVARSQVSQHATDASPAAPVAVSVRGRDLAVYRPVSEPLKAGDVVVADRRHPGLLESGKRMADPAVVGVITGDPGILAGERIREMGEMMPEVAAALEAGLRSGDRAAVQDAWQTLQAAFDAVHAPVVTFGIVSTRVDADYGAVAVGDLLTTSPTRGHAMRADEPEPGTVLGKALEPLAEGRGKLDVLLILR